MKNNITIIQGERGEGKTTFVKAIVEELKANAISVGGILAEGFWKEGMRDRFQLVDLKTNSKLAYCQREKKEAWEKVAQFYVNPKGQEFGEQLLMLTSLYGVDFLVVDEIGPFELEGKGWTKAIRKLIRQSDLPMLWVVRNSLVEEVLHYFKTEDFQKFNIQNSTPEEVAIFIKKEILNR
jgi:nucleoside-triphosphatase THEP1